MSGLRTLMEAEDCIEELEAIAELKLQLRHYTKAEMENVMKESLAGYAELEDELRKANARADAAEKFARHDPNCTFHKGVQYTGDCSCGFDNFKRGNYEKP